MAYSRCLIMKNKPRIRFKGFTKDWEQRKLGECVDISTGYPFDSQDFNENGEYLVITNGNIQENTPFVLNNVGNRIDLDDSLKKYILDIDDLLITMDGTVGRVAIVVDNKLVLAQRVCRIKSNEPYYIYQLLSKNDFIQSMNKIGHGGTIKHISLSEISEYQAFYPKSQKEKIKISNVLTNCDKLITLHQRKLEKLKLAKKALLQKLFPKNGSKFPELRFKGFTNAWEQCKLGDLLILLKDGSHGTHKNTSEGVYLLSAKNIKNGRINIMPDDRIISWDDYNVIHKNYELQSGDILLTIVGSIGETAIYNLKTKVTFQRSVAFLRPNSKLKNGFLYTLINTDRFQNQLQTKQVVSAQPGIYLGDLAGINIKYPKNISEQEKIYNIFKGIENSITLHQRKLDKLQEVKKGLLQKMFV